jgi:hypothetical protein
MSKSILIDYSKVGLQVAILDTVRMLTCCLLCSVWRLSHAHSKQLTGSRSALIQLCSADKRRTESH